MSKSKNVELKFFFFFNQRKIQHFCSKKKKSIVVVTVWVRGLLWILTTVSVWPRLKDHAIILFACFVGWSLPTSVTSRPRKLRHQADHLAGRLLLHLPDHWPPAPGCRCLYKPDLASLLWWLQTAEVQISLSLARPATQSTINPTQTRAGGYKFGAKLWQRF